MNRHTFLDKLKFSVFAVSFALLPSITAAEAKVVAYPAPVSERVKTGWTLEVDGKPIDIYRAHSPQFEGGEYFYAMFDFEGRVSVKAKCRIPAKGKMEIFPQRFEVSDVSQKEISFFADKPFNAAIIRDERVLPLVIFGNPIEKDAPKAGDPNVLYFGAGVHVADNIQLKSNQTLYLAGGAVLKASVTADNAENVSIRGRGIISGELYMRHSRALVRLEKCRNVSVSDVVITEPPSWTLVFQYCDRVKIDNLKICGSRMLNDDGIDICNTSNVKIENTFIRCQDDCIAVKGMYGKLPCTNIDIQNCTLWTDIANTFRIGYECAASEMSKILVQNIDIPFYAASGFREPTEQWAKGLIWFQAANDMPMHDIHFKNINVRSSGVDIVVLLANPRITRHRKSMTAGRIFDCSIKNLKVYGVRGGFKGMLWFKGFDADRDVKNISLENIEYFGERIDSSYKYFVDEKFHTSNISIK